MANMENIDKAIEHMRVVADEDVGLGGDFLTLECLQDYKKLIKTIQEEKEEAEKEHKKMTWSSNDIEQIYLQKLYIGAELQGKIKLANKLLEVEEC